jgi:hypothetical protein
VSLLDEFDPPVLIAEGEHDGWPWALELRTNSEDLLDPPLVLIRDARHEAGSGCSAWPRDWSPDLSAYATTVVDEGHRTRQVILGSVIPAATEIEFLPDDGPSVKACALVSLDGWERKLFAVLFDGCPDGVAVAKDARGRVIAEERTGDPARAARMQKYRERRSRLRKCGVGGEEPASWELWATVDDRWVEAEIRTARGATGGWGVPVDDDRMVRLAGIFASPAGPSYWSGYAAEDVDRVEVELIDGRVVAADLVRSVELPTNLFVAVIEPAVRVERLLARDSAGRELSSFNLPLELIERLEKEMSSGD